MRVPIGSFQTSNQDVTLPIHPEKESQDESPQQGDSDQLSLKLHPIPAQDALLVEIQPPRVPGLPADGSKPPPHVPCDIVLVIDVSGSMASEAIIPGESESTGLSVLDLVKHAAKTIMETMDSRDRLGIVTFGARSMMVQRLLSMSDANKSKATENIDSMRANGATNLWHGILDGFKLFENAPKSTNVPAIMILTDGLPNHMCPSMGYIPKLRTMMPFPGSIHAFGFGYRLRSGLLKSIAEIGGGNYAFIPDAGMIGTVFVNAVANLQSTFAMAANLRLKYPAPLELEETTGASVEQTPPDIIHSSDINNSATTVLNIRLGNLQYGQPRHILLRVKNLPSLKELEAFPERTAPLVSASLMFSRAADPSIPQPSGSAGWNFFQVSTRDKTIPGPASLVSVSRSLLDASDLSAAEIAYHESRAQICTFLSSIFPFSPKDNERRCRKFTPDTFPELQSQLAFLISKIPAREHSDEMNQSLMDDLTGDEPHGQISIAINDESHFNRWGVHYLPSYLNAHTRQICNSFKDSGPLQYGANSPLFLACRTRLDTAFDNLPPPQPSLLNNGGFHLNRRGPPSYSSSSRSSRSPPSARGYGFSMSMYNRSSGPCFAASTPVELASGRTVRISRLRRGMKVQTPAGPRRVALVLKTPVQDQVLCRVGDLLVTPWHPISHNGGKTWCFPAFIADNPVRYSGAIYSILLQQDRRSEAHAIHVAGTWGVTLGHGVTTGDDVRAHDFLGSWASVAKSLAVLGPDNRGVVVGGGVQRDDRSGQVCGFKTPEGKENILHSRTEGVLVG